MTKAIGFNAIAGQQQPIRLLKTLVRNGTLPHALLFTGNEGVGKRMAASALAMACNCLTLKSKLSNHLCLDAVDACGACDACRKIAGNNHPDVIRVRPLTSVIKIAQIRTLLQTLSLKPNEADRRVVILSEAHAMNAEASNALLKVLEEPPDRTLIVLTAIQTSDLLPTVVSRCRHTRFAPLAEADIEKLLRGSDGLEPKTAATAASLCGGSVTRARQLIDCRHINQRDWIAHAMERLLRHRGDSDLRAWLALSEALAKKKERLEEALGIITMWLRDVMVLNIDPLRVMNQDRLESLAAIAGCTRQSQLIEQIDAVDSALAALRSNTNIRLTLDAMVLRMAGACV